MCVVLTIDFRAVKYLKLCSKCNRVFPATPEHFHRNRSLTDGLHSNCKKCTSKLWKERFERNKEKKRQEQKNKELKKLIEKSESHPQMKVLKQCTVCKEVFPATSDYFYTRDKGRRLASLCIECDNLRGKKQYQKNKEKISNYSKAYYQKNKERIAEYQKKYREKTKEKIPKREKD